MAFDEVLMKSDVVPEQPIQSTTTDSSFAEFSPVARSSSSASDDENAAKYLFKLSRDVILSLDRSGNILCINQRGVELSGYSESELRGSNISDRLILLEDRPAITAILQDLVQGNTREYEIRWKTKQGAMVHLDGVSVPRLSENGEFLSTLCTLRDITGRKRAEEKLRKSEEKYRDLIEISPDAIYVIDANGVCVLGNRAGAELAGLSQNELLGSPVTDTYLPEERHLFQERLKKLESESTLRFERKFVRTNQEIVPVEVSVSAIKGGYFQAIVRDISERKRAEEALRVAHENYVGLVNSLDGIVWESDAQTFAFTFVSPQAEHILGYPASRWTAEPTFWKDHIHPDDRQWATTFCMDATLAKRPHDFEYRMVAADGRVVWIHDVVTVIVENDQPVRLRGVMLDITERKQAEEALRESEERYRVLVEFSPNSICVHRDGKLLYVSPAGVRLFGATDLAELVGRSVLDFIHPDSLAAVRDRIRQVREGETAPLIEEKFVTLNGEVRDVEVTSIPIIYERAPAAQVIIRDITERKQGEALLTGEKRLLEMIATGVELKEILNTLCLIIEEQRAGTLASVLLLNSDGAHLDFVAGPNLPSEWTRQMEKLPIGPCAGSCGTAAYRRSAVIASDISTDPMWNVPEHRASALKHGLRASWSNPILSSRGKLLGTFCMYYRQPRTPSSQDLELIDLATHLVRIAIERDRAEDALRASEQLARGQVEALTYSLDVLATAPAPNKFLGQMLSTMGRLLGAQSVILWLVNEATESLVFRAAAQGANFEAADPEHPFAKNPLLWREDKVLQETVFTGAPVIIEDVENDPRVTAEVREYFKSSGTRKYLTIPTMVGGEVKGFIGIRHGDRPPYRPEEIELAQALAHQAMLAIQLNEFAEQSQQSAILEERNRMARDIHDTLAQGFTGVIVQLDASIEALRDEEPEGSAKHIRRARELARESLTEARRSVHALRPQVLEQATFPDALKAIIQNTTAGTSLRADFDLDGEPGELAPSVEEHLLHIGQEALTNALKHAHATEFRARLSFDPDAVRLALRDNGEGFVVDTTNGGGFGLIGMKERAEQIGATLTILSKPGAGTEIIAVSPYQHPVKT
jgi:PAS domain S-box-containing protein